MKILHILNELRYSGAEVMLSCAAPIFIKKGYETHILSAGNSPGEFAPILANDGYTIRHLRFSRNPAFIGKVFKLMRREKYEVVHIHCERAFYWYAAAARCAGIPTIIRTVHSLFPFCGWLRWKRFLQRRTADIFWKVGFIAPGESVLANEIKRFKNTCILVRNWTRLDHFRPPTEEERNCARAKYRIQGHDFVIMTIGACSPIKNHEAIFRTLKALIDNNPKRGFYFLHGGSGPNINREKELVDRLGIKEKCHFIDQTIHIREILWASDVFVMSSQYEGLPIVLLEAMATGLPVVINDKPGMRDILRNGKGGILVSPPNEKNLAKAIRSIAESPDEIKRLGQEAREEVLQNFDMEKSLSLLMSIYEAKRTRKYGQKSAFTWFHNPRG